MNRRFFSCLLLILLAVTPSLAAEKARWLHVRVHDGGPDGETVHINVPLSLVDGILPLLEEKQREQVPRFRLDGSDLDRAELQKILARLRGVPEEAEALLEKDGERLWFSRAGKRLQIRVEEGGEGQPRAEVDPRQPRAGRQETRILIPMKLAEALAASPESDLKAAIQSFEDDGEILVVDGEDGTTVRVWIDDRSGTERGGR